MAGKIIAAATSVSACLLLLLVLIVAHATNRSYRTESDLKQIRQNMEQISGWIKQHQEAEAIIKHQAESFLKHVESMKKTAPE